MVKKLQIRLPTIKLFLNPESALDFVTKLNYPIKSSAHGLFLNKEYFCILILKIEVSA
ncbi:hypothetical protein CLU83_1959 [Flavobacterium sp. 1]|nr:hypothetical protein CLU83_1959 [Flavobacterium sp. 1]